MATIKEILEYQKNFDIKHGWYWGETTEEKKLGHLQYAVMAMTGELGEFANALKKAIREFNAKKTIPKEVETDGKIIDLESKLREEITDVFIYTVKVALALGMDLEKEYFDKMKKNEVKHEKFLV
jgi:NTP pyrophosphatase (non-canonical NTP hydrolase)